MSTANDPWLDATVSSEFRPGVRWRATHALLSRSLPGGAHCSDLYAQNWAANPTVKSIVDEEVSILTSWVEDYYRAKERH